LFLPFLASAARLNADCGSHGGNDIAKSSHAAQNFVFCFNMLSRRWSRKYWSRFFVFTSFALGYIMPSKTFWIPVSRTPMHAIN
jgi:hypothetical protein